MPLPDLIEAKTSAIHGLGVFAKEDIPAGTIWWRGEPNVNILFIHPQQYHVFQASTNNPLKTDFWNMIAHYAYYSQPLDCLIVCLDDARYLNHSFEPNSGALQDGNPLVSVALRDIAKGEEIVENYQLYDPCPWAPEIVTQQHFQRS